MQIDSIIGSSLNGMARYASRCINHHIIHYGPCRTSLDTTTTLTATYRLQRGVVLDIDFSAEMSRIQAEMRAVLVQEKHSQKMLEDAGIPATVRRSLGGDIDASCGQLRRKYTQSQGKE